MILPFKTTRILILDTCTTTGGIALAEVNGDQAKVMSARVITGKTFAAELIPAISDLLQEAGMRVADLSAVAVVHGPGSFTGVRIGVSTAKGLVEAAAIPLIAISRLAVLAHKSPAPGRAIAVLDAGRGEFYTGIYDGALCSSEALMSYEEVVSATEPGRAQQFSTLLPTLVTCEEVTQAVFAALEPRMVSQPTPADALSLVVARWQQAAFDEALTLDGNYLRRLDSEIFSRQAGDIEAKRKGKEEASHAS